MKGILLEFTDKTPFKCFNVYFTCKKWSEFEEKLQSCFNQGVYLLEYDSLDRDNHITDGHLRIGDYHYACNIKRIWQEI